MILTQSPAVAHFSSNPSGIFTLNSLCPIGTSLSLFPGAYPFFHTFNISPTISFRFVSTILTFAEPSCGIRIHTLSGTTWPADHTCVLLAGLSENCRPLQSQRLQVEALEFWEAFDVRRVVVVDGAGDRGATERVQGRACGTGRG
jgi:hypothetical protein